MELAGPNLLDLIKDTRYQARERERERE